MYKFFLDGILLPITPQKMQISIQNNNKSITLINDGEINFLKAPGLSEITFEALIPSVVYPFAVYDDGFEAPTYFLNAFEKLKTSRKPFQLIIARKITHGAFFDSNIFVSLESYEIQEDADNGFDIVVSFKLKQFRKFSTKKITLDSGNNGKVEKIKDVNVEDNGNKLKKTHTVVKGDCLWAIAKKYLGDGNKYIDLYKLNKTMLDKRNKGTNLSKYTIYSGQVIKLG